MDLLVGEARGGPDGTQLLEASGAVAGLLLELPRGTRLRRLAGVELPGRDLEQIAARGEAVLADQHDPPIVEEGNHRRRPRMLQQIEEHAPSVGQVDPLGDQLELRSPLDAALAHLDSPLQRDFFSTRPMRAG